MLGKIKGLFKREKYGHTKKYLTKNAKPYFPIMGEIHYARTNRATWREEMVKMKSCGIDTITTYIFWIYHEPVEGEYDFTGNFDIRTFIKTADELGLKVWIRVGPFIHAELRNGGFPDWLIEKCPKIRCNDETYIKEVEKYFKRVYEELEGLFYKDGGPITGIQVENELGHVGGGTRPENEDHLKLLIEILKDIGYNVPYYTATGWGTATVGECIPVMGGYCETPWDRSGDKLGPSKNYVITKERDDHMIGWDREIGVMESYNYDDFPFLTAELGGGLCLGYRRRPTLEASDIGAVSVVKLANGCNCLGYYMFHGGICPKGSEYPFNETIATGSWSDLPEFDYNFWDRSVHTGILEIHSRN